jgi:hypothetical protein
MSRWIRPKVKQIPAIVGQARSIQLMKSPLRRLAPRRAARG